MLSISHLSLLLSRWRCTAFLLLWRQGLFRFFFPECLLHLRTDLGPSGLSTRLPALSSFSFSQPWTLIDSVARSCHCQYVDFDSLSLLFFKKMGVFSTATLVRRLDLALLFVSWSTAIPLIDISERTQLGHDMRDYTASMQLVRKLECSDHFLVQLMDQLIYFQNRPRINGHVDS